VVVERSSFQFGLATIRMVGFLALSSAPLLLVLRGGPPGRWGGRVALGLMALASAAAAAFLASGRPPTFGNLLSEFGLFSEDLVLLGRREVILGTGWTWAFALLALLAAMAMIRLACGVRWGQLRDFLRGGGAGPAPDDPGEDRGRAVGFGGVLMIAGAMMLPIFLVRGAYFDRYLLPALPAVWVALAKCGPARSRARRAASVALVVASAIFSTTVASDYFRWNEARWAAARKLASRGVAPGSINAGYEWFGMMVGDTDHPSMNPEVFDYVVSFSGPSEGFREVDSVPWKAIWPPHDRTMHVLENRATRGR
jgi:phage gp37-like protein